AIIVLSTVVGLLLNFLGVNPMKMLIYTAVINGVVAVPLLVVIMGIANNRRIMGEYANGWLANTLGSITVAVMAAAAVVLGISFIW
ncbi:MAG: divalent metal cation transporter, partial [Patescibacteria group bacterium]